MTIRPTAPSDIPALQTVLDLTGLFPSEMLPEMIYGFLKNDAPQDLWLTAVVDDLPLGLCYARPEPLSEGTWNMFALAVHPDHQRRGLGCALTDATEQHLAATGARQLIVDTSGTAEFAQTRLFYARRGYVQEAILRAYWAKGDDKVTFSKPLVTGRRG